MEIVNLLEFLNKTKELHALDYATFNSDSVNFLDIISVDEQFTQKIDLGLIFIRTKTLDQCTIIDGLSRILSLSLLLHAICECYKRTSSKNESAIKTIRMKYLYNNSKTKLRLPQELQVIYDKILNGERLSGKEKATPVFQLLHKYWTQIQEEKLQASKMFNMLNKIFVVLVETGQVPHRDLYISLNKDKRTINQLALIENYLKNIGLLAEWGNILKIYNNNKNYINVFFNDYFITKFNFRESYSDSLYNTFVNYFETMLQYHSEDELMAKIRRSAKLYNDIMNLTVKSESLKKLLIQIKMNGGEDTFAYILNIYEDFIDGILSEATVLEILSTINDYLKKRSKTPNNVTFNELIDYLNAFITCK